MGTPEASLTILTELIDSILRNEKSYDSIAALFSGCSDEVLTTELSTRKSFLQLALKHRNAPALIYLSDRNVDFERSMPRTMGTPEASLTILTELIDSILRNEKSYDSIAALFSGCSDEALTTELSKRKSFLQLALKHRNAPALIYLSDRYIDFESLFFHDYQSAKQYARSIGGSTYDLFKARRSEAQSRLVWMKEADDIMIRYKSLAADIEISKDNWVNLLDRAQAFAIRHQDSAPTYDPMPRHWNIPIWEFRNQQTLLGLMLLTRMSRQPPHSCIYDAIKSGNRAAFYYLIIRMRKFSVCSAVQFVSIQKLFPELLKNLHAYTSNESVFQLDVPKDVIAKWSVLQGWSPHYLEQSALCIIKDDDYTISVEMH